MLRKVRSLSPHLPQGVFVLSSSILEDFLPEILDSTDGVDVVVELLGCDNCLRVRRGEILDDELGSVGQRLCAELGGAHELPPDEVLKSEVEGSTVLLLPSAEDRLELQSQKEGGHLELPLLLLESKRTGLVLRLQTCQILVGQLQMF